MKQLSILLFAFFFTIDNIIAQTDMTIDLSGKEPDVRFSIDGKTVDDQKLYLLKEANTITIIPNPTNKHLISIKGGSAEPVQIIEETTLKSNPKLKLVDNVLTWNDVNKTFSFNKSGAIEGYNFNIPYPPEISVFNIVSKGGALTNDSSPIFQKKLGSEGNQDTNTETNYLTEALKLIDNNPSYRERFKNPYDVQNNKVYLFFYRDRLISKKPVNVDEDDEFIPIIVALDNEIDFYKINIIEGDYAPIDLAFRPFEPTGVAEAVAQAKEDKKPTPILVIRQLPAEGPFTTERFRFTVNRFVPSSDVNKSPKVETSETYSFRINNLYHVGVGVSFIRTNLSDPEYKVTALPDNAGNTIIITDDSPRTLLTFNVIWYWTVFQNPAGSGITRGRDVLKDEEALTIKRVFPTIGVSINDDITHNFFGGLVYEFARGGSIIAGGHYGRQQVLADKNFRLGETVFSGTNEDIVLTDDYQIKFFLGVNVDTRIVRALFGRGATQ